MYKSRYHSIFFYLIFIYVWKGKRQKIIFMFFLFVCLLVYLLFGFFFLICLLFFLQKHHIKYATVFQLQSRWEILLKGNELSSSLKSLSQFVCQVKPVLTEKSLFLYFKADSKLVKDARLAVQKGEVICLFMEEMLLVK